MEKIDRLGWAAGFSFTSYGVRVGVRTNKSEVLERIQNHLPPGWKPASSPLVDVLYSLRAGGEGRRPGLRQFNLVFVNLQRFARTLDLDEALEQFESNLQLSVAQNAKRRVFVHAGVVGWKGQAILIPGRSFSGKTTLVAELVRAGAIYYSDEYAVLDAQGRVHPYARPLGIRDSPLKHPQKHPVETLGGAAGNKPLRVALVIASHYRPGARRAAARLSPGKGVLEMLRHTVSARLKPETALSTLWQVAAGAAILKGARGEAKDFAARLLEKIG